MDFFGLLGATGGPSTGSDGITTDIGPVAPPTANGTGEVVAMKRCDVSTFPILGGGVGAGGVMTILGGGSGAGKSLPTFGGGAGTGKSKRILFDLPEGVGVAFLFTPALDPLLSTTPLVAGGVSPAGLPPLVAVFATAGISLGTPSSIFGWIVGAVSTTGSVVEGPVSIGSA